MEDFLLTIGEKCTYFQISSKNSNFQRKIHVIFTTLILKPKTNANFALSGPIFEILNSKEVYSKSYKQSGCEKIILQGAAVGCVNNLV